MAVDEVWTANFEYGGISGVTTESTPTWSPVSANRSYQAIVDVGAGYHALYVSSNATITTVAVNGTVTGGGSHAIGNVITLVATPSAGYRFKQWSDGMTSPIRFVHVKSNLTLTAQFVPLIIPAAAAADLDTRGEYMHTTIGDVTPGGSVYPVREIRGNGSPYVILAEDAAHFAEWCAELSNVLLYIKGSGSSAVLDGGPWACAVDDYMRLKGRAAAAADAAGCQPITQGPNYADIVGGMAAINSAIRDGGVDGYLKGEYVTPSSGAVTSSAQPDDVANAAIGSSRQYIGTADMSSWPLRQQLFVDTLADMSAVAADLDKFRILCQISPNIIRVNSADAKITRTITKSIRYSDYGGYYYQTNTETTNSQSMSDGQVGEIAAIETDTTFAREFGQTGPTVHGVSVSDPVFAAVARTKDEITTTSVVLWPDISTKFEIDTNVPLTLFMRNGSPILRVMVVWICFEVTVTSGGSQPNLMVRASASVTAGLPTYCDAVVPEGETDIFTQRITGSTPEYYTGSVNTVVVPTVAEYDSGSTDTAKFTIATADMRSAIAVAMTVAGRGECGQEAILAEHALATHAVPPAESADGLWHPSAANVTASTFSADLPDVSVKVKRVLTLYDAAPFASRGCRG